MCDELRLVVGNYQANVVELYNSVVTLYICFVHNSRWSINLFSIIASESVVCFFEVFANPYMHPAVGVLFLQNTSY